MAVYEGIIRNSWQSFLEVASSDDDVAIGNGIGHHTQEYFQANSHALQLKSDSVCGQHFPFADSTGRLYLCRRKALLSEMIGPLT